MRLFLITLCLVGLAQAGPAAPSFITDPQIRALYELTDIRVKKVTWNNPTGDGSIPKGQKFDIEVCIDKLDGFDQTTTIGVLRRGSEQHQLGNVNDITTNATSGTSCYIFKNKDKIAVDGDALTFEVWNSGDFGKLAVGSIEKYLNVTKVTPELNCNEEPGNDGISFGSEEGKKKYDNQILVCLEDIGDCIFKKGQFPKTWKRTGDLFCISEDEDEQISYCQQVVAPEAGELGVDSLEYGGSSANTIKFQKKFSANTNVTVCIQDGSGKLSGCSDKIIADAKTQAITLNEKAPTDNNYCVIAKPVNGKPQGTTKIGSIQDLKVNLKRTEFQEKPFYTFDFQHKQDGGRKYQANSGKDTETIVCIKDVKTCYGFLQPEGVKDSVQEDQPAVYLSYYIESSDSHVTKNKIVVP